jgi:eukaryotic-like serine/threonine-protein kinase
MPLSITWCDSTSTPFCWDFDSSFDATRLFVSQCTASPNPSGPGPRPASRPQCDHCTYSNRLCIYLPVCKSGSGFHCCSCGHQYDPVLQVGNMSGNTSQNGLWRVGTVGSHPQRLTTSGALNQFTQFPWSNVSRDGSRYVLQIINSTSSGTTYTLEYGSLSGSSPVVFAPSPTCNWQQ